MSTSNDTLEEVVADLIHGNNTQELVEVSIGKLLGIGAGVGATLGGIKGYRDAKKNKANKLKGTFKGSAKGAAVGAAGALMAPYVKSVVTKLLRLFHRTSRATKVYTIAIGAPTVTAVLDLVKSRGYKKDSNYVMDAIKNKEIVASKQFASKIDKKIIVATNAQEIYSALKKERKLAAEVSDFALRMMATSLGQEIKSRTNAFALRGEQIDLIAVPSKTNAHVIAHEIGHILDFREKRITMWNMRQYQRTLSSLVLKHKHKAQVMDAEVAAWDKSPSDDSDDKRTLRKSALGTYQKSFHLVRSVFMTYAALSIMLVAAADYINRNAPRI